MTDDLRARLLDKSGRWTADGDPLYVCEEAAAEIERLQATVARLEGELKQATDYIVALLERDKARAALAGKGGDRE